MTKACGGMQSMYGKMTYALVYSCIGSVVGGVRSEDDASL